MPAPQIKICGITSIETAQYCADLGVEAIGLVFFAKSPRNVTIELADGISRAVGTRLQRVGLFVDQGYDAIMRHVERCHLTAVQLHGSESPDLVTKLRARGLRVVKALFQSRDPLFSRASAYSADGFLLECGKGRMPGGNAEIWDWQAAANMASQVPVVLAGGLNPENVGAAIGQALPDAVDVSSGVESAPGVKNHAKIRMFVKAARACDTRQPLRRIF